MSSVSHPHPPAPKPPGSQEFCDPSISSSIEIGEAASASSTWGSSSGACLASLEGAGAATTWKHWHSLETWPPAHLPARLGLQPAGKTEGTKPNKGGEYQTEFIRLELIKYSQKMGAHFERWLRLKTLCFHCPILDRKLRFSEIKVERFYFPPTCSVFT